MRSIQTPASWRKTCWLGHAEGSEDTHFAEHATKTDLLELRKKHLAMGCSLRCYPYFHLFDAQELVRKWRTAGLMDASKPHCFNPAGWTGTY
jgi:hypothetical protein